MCRRVLHRIQHDIRLPSMQAPIVSIVVPVYNVQPYLSKCLDSLAAQTLANIELILVDDGSTDSSLAVCQAFAVQDSRFKVFAKKNGGQGIARNFGLEQASGTYVCYVDSDDWVEPSLCADLVQVVEQTDADFVNFAFDFVSSSGSVKQGMRAYRQDELAQPALFEMALLDDQVFSVPWNKLYRRDLLLQHDIRFPSTRINEDIFYSRAVAYVSGNAAFLPKVLYHALVRPGSTSRHMTVDHFVATREVLEREREFFNQHSGPHVCELLFSAHVVKLFSYLLIQAAFRVASVSDYRKCFDVANEAGFFELAASAKVLKKLSRKNQLLAFTCRHPSLLRVFSRAARVAGISPY